MEKMCKNCGTPITKEYCEGYPEVCEHWTPKKPKTNADRIRAMSDEELAVGIKKIFIGVAPWCDHHCKLDDDCSCNTCLREWLKKPAEGE